MCGINGIFQYKGIDELDSRISAMNQRIEKRGPDAEGIAKFNQLHLGHRRLSILDIGISSNQPFQSPDKRYTLVFNGEIYNFKEIRSQLSNYSFVTQGDTEVILAAFITWGENCLRSFNGMFAFAIWDDVKKELFVARDRLGIKPLYYSLSKDHFAFSSSVKAILASQTVEAKLDPTAVLDYFRYQTVHAPKTIVKDVFALMPGHSVKITEDEPPIFKCYWKITKEAERFDQHKDVKNHVRTLLRQSVERRMIADVPFGAFLSGGIDSSIIVGLMNEVQTNKVQTFSVVFKEDKFSEAPYAQEIAKRYSTEHHELELSANDFKDLLPQALKDFDHPSGDGPNTYIVSQKTRDAGIKMALTGLGGDELFGGYSVFSQVPSLMEKGWLRSFPVYGRKPMASLYHLLKGTVSSAKIKAIMSLEEFDLEYIYQFYRQVLLDAELKKIFKNAGDLPESSVLLSVHEEVGYKTDGWQLPPMSRISVAEITTYMQNVLLRDADQMSMAHGLELRVPFLDHELVSYVLGLPDKQKKGEFQKHLLVDSCKDLISENIYKREKMGFVLPYELWMKTELKSFCEERLNHLQRITYLNHSYILSLWNRFQKGDKQITWSRMWPLVVLGDWIKENGIEG